MAHHPLHAPRATEYLLCHASARATYDAVHARGATNVAALFNAHPGNADDAVRECRNTHLALYNNTMIAAI
jgi:hypothetical protein